MASQTPQSTQDALALIDACVGRWDAGGREQLHEAFIRSWQDDAQGTSSAAPAPSRGFVLLFSTFLSHHCLSPKLAPSALAAIVRALAEGPAKRAVSPAEPNEDGASGSDTNGAVEGGSTDELVDATLDSVWGFDAELDVRREMAEAAGKTSLLDGVEAGKGLLEEVRAARGRLADVVKELLRGSLVPRRVVAERLEVPLLKLVGLIDDEQAFTKKGVRINTANLYKQQKFNLLREENEGYSGLITELIGGMGPPVIAVADEGEAESPLQAAVRVVEQEDAATRNARAAKVMSNVSALIGYFDLDPNRVLDVILDIFSSNVVRHWPFFLALFAASPWQPDALLQGRQKTSGAGGDAMDVDGPSSSEPQRVGPVTIDFSSARGNRTCAQLLGFKFGHYQQQDVREETPDDLFLMAALLVRAGYVRYLDLLPHLSPDEEGMKKRHADYRKSLSERAAAGRVNALTMAAPLADERTGMSSAEAAAAAAKENAEKAALKEAPNQIVGLLRALLAMGQLPEALFLLGRYSWLCGAHPDVADLYIRLLKAIIEPAYAPISLVAQLPHTSRGTFVPLRRYDVKRQGLFSPPPPRLLITSTAPEPLTTAGSRLVFFFQDWRSGLPKLGPSEVLTQFVPLLRILGPHLHRDLTLLQQLCRFGKVGMRTAAQADSPEDKAKWLEVVRALLLLALSLTSGNSGLNSEIWAILRQLPYEERFALYGEWKYELYRRPELKPRQTETEKEARGILKRISADNLKLSGRALAKASHANPTIFFTVALNQVQAYDNLVGPIVESAKYLTHLEYDVFGFNLIDALSNPDKERTKQDGTNISLWLKSLAAFTGTLYRRYGMMDCTPVLQYIANQLKANNSKDLVIVRELVLKMTGIEPLANLADKQVAALTGGRLLSMEARMAANAGLGTPARAQLRKSGARLLAALQQSRMLVPLLVLIAQQRQACIHLVPENEAHLKYLGNLFDSCQEILFQFVDFLNHQLDPPTYASTIPSLPSLTVRFGVEPAIAFHLARPRLVWAIKRAEDKEAEEQLRAELTKSRAKAAAKKAAEEAAAAAAAETAAEATGDAEESPAKAEADAMDTDAPAETVDAAPVPVKAEESEEAQASSTAPSPSPPVKPIWREGMKEAIEAAEEILPDNVKETLGTHFYATFWQLSLADIVVPTERYDQEIRSLQQMMREADADGKKGNPRARQQAADTVAQLRAELKERTLAHQTTRKRLALEKDHWFVDGAPRTQIVAQMLQHCLIPRALLSPTDAIFSAKFLRLMHSHGTRNFSSLNAYDKILAEHVASITFASTENEARNYARFLQVILADLSAWHADAQLYKKEALGERLPGFQMRWGQRHGGEEIPAGDFCAWESFRQVTHKWHTALRTAFKECLVSREYMRVRNAIVVMTRIAPHFPLLDAHGTDMVQTVQGLVDEEQRGDLKILGQGLLATLRKRQKEWIPQHRFIEMPNPPPEAKPAPARTPSAAPAEAKQAPAVAKAQESATASTPPRRSPTAAAQLPKGPAADRGKPAPQQQQLQPPGRNQRMPSDSSVPRGPRGDRRQDGASTPTGPPPSSGDARGREATDAGDRSKAGLPARPGRDDGRDRRDDRRNGPNGAGADREPPKAPRDASNGSSNAAAAARQAALDSMNPPKAAASTPDANAVRARAARGDHLNEPSRGRGSGAATPTGEGERGIGRDDERERKGRERDRERDRDRDSDRDRSSHPSPRTVNASREPSPRRSSRAGSYDSSHSRRERSERERSDRDRERSDRSDGREREDKDRERERERERERDKDRSGRREPRSYDEPPRRPWGRERLAGDDAPASPAAAPPTGPRASRDDRSARDGDGRRRPGPDGGQSAPSPQQASQDVGRGPPPPRGPAGERDRIPSGPRELLSGSPAERETGGASPGGGSRKRSLADRLGGSEAAGGAAGRGGEEPDNKRARTGGDDIPTGPRGDSTRTGPPDAPRGGGGVSIRGAAGGAAAADGRQQQPPPHHPSRRGSDRPPRDDRAERDQRVASSSSSGRREGGGGRDGRDRGGRRRDEPRGGGGGGRGGDSRGGPRGEDSRPATPGGEDVGGSGGGGGDRRRSRGPRSDRRKGL